MAPQVKAKYDYNSGHEDDLSFSAGQIITVTEEVDEEWYNGEYVDGHGNLCQGMFPRNFVVGVPAQRIDTSIRATKQDDTTVPASVRPTESAKGPVPPTKLAVSPSITLSTKPVISPTDTKPDTESRPSPPLSKTAVQTSHSDTPQSKSEKVSSFRDRIAAFNKTADAPLKPNAMPKPTSFVRKPFIPPPPSKAAYLPPPKPPQPVKPTPVHRDFTEEPARYTEDEHTEEPEISRESLKERILAIQRGLDYATKPPPPIPAPRRTESHTEVGDAAKSPASEQVLESHPLEDTQTDQRRDSRFDHESHDADTTVEGVQISKTEEPERISPQSEEDNDEEDAIPEVDPEVARRMAIRERMAKMSGGMGMHMGMGMGPPPIFSKTKPQRTSTTSPPSSPSSERQEAIPIIPGLPPLKPMPSERDTRPPRHEDRSEEVSELPRSDDSPSTQQLSHSAGDGEEHGHLETPIHDSSDPESDEDESNASLIEEDEDEVEPEVVTSEVEDKIGKDAPPESPIVGNAKAPSTNTIVHTPPPRPISVRQPSGPAPPLPPVPQTQSESAQRVRPPPPPPPPVSSISPAAPPPPIPPPATFDSLMEARSPSAASKEPLYDEYDSEESEEPEEPEEPEQPRSTNYPSRRSLPSSPVSRPPPPPPPHPPVSPPIPSSKPFSPPPIPATRTFDPQPHHHEKRPSLPPLPPPAPFFMDEVSPESNSGDNPPLPSSPSSASFRRSQTERPSTEMKPRSSMDRTRRDGSYLAMKEENIQDGREWWLEPGSPPTVFKSRADLCFEVEDSTSTRRGGHTSVTRQVYILFGDYSQTIVTAQYDRDDPSHAALSQRHLPPPSPPSKDELETRHNQIGDQIVALAQAKVGLTVGDGSFFAFIQDVLGKVENCLPSAGLRSHGALIYSNLGNSSSIQYDEIRSGDIVAFRNAVFQSHGGLRGKMLIEAGKPDLAGIVQEWNGSKRKLKILEQRPEVRRVAHNSYKLGELKSGEVHIFRPMPRSWVDW